MLNHYLLISLRSLRKRAFFSSLNVLGLTLGLSGCLLIYIYVTNEFAYDQFHAQGDRIYQVLRRFELNGQPAGAPKTAGPFAPALLEEFGAEITHAVRVLPAQRLVQYEGQVYAEKQFYYADSAFFEVFSFPLLKGNPQTVLDKPNGVVISQQLARKYFGTSEPVGKVILVDKQAPYQVTGVLAPFPGNSHLQFDLVASLGQVQRQDWFNGWWNNSLVTYVLLASQVSAQKLEAKFPAFMDKHLGADFKQIGSRQELSLLPLGEVYFTNTLKFDPFLHGDKAVLYMFALAAGLILFIATVNFMNLATARSLERAREVGLRKALGAGKGQLVSQFLGEAFVLTLLSLVLAVSVLVAGLGQLSVFVGKVLPDPFGEVSFYLFLLSLLLVVGLLAGSYPAFLQSAFRPVAVLKGKLVPNRQGIGMRKGLVVFQFSVSIVLVVATLVMNKQLGYLLDKKLGFEKKQVLLIRLSNQEILQDWEQFSAQLRSLGQVESVTAMSGEPGGYHDAFGFTVEGKHEQTWQLRTVFTDHHYVKTLDLTIIAGRDFSTAYGTDPTEGLLLNQTAVKKLGWTPTQALGKALTNKNFFNPAPYRVVGVVEDFHFSSLKDPIEPLAITFGRNPKVIAVKVTASRLEPLLAGIKKRWQGLSPYYPFTYEFLDQAYANLYQSEKKQSHLFGYFSCLALCVACLGLIGLAGYAAALRVKEIGIRKVVGASVPSIILLLSREFLLLLVIALGLALPVAAYLMEEWLNNYAYRVNLSWWEFGQATVLALLVALLTVGALAFKAAVADPIQSLRSE